MLSGTYPDIFKTVSVIKAPSLASSASRSSALSAMSPSSIMPSLSSRVSVLLPGSNAGFSACLTRTLPYASYCKARVASLLLVPSPAQALPLLQAPSPLLASPSVAKTPSIILRIPAPCCIEAATASTSVVSAPPTVSTCSSKKRPATEPVPDERLPGWKNCACCKHHKKGCHPPLDTEPPFATWFLCL